MDKLFPPSRRRILAGIATIALSTGGFAVARADDAVPLRIGVLTDMSSLYAVITGPGSVAAAKMAVEDFLAGPHKMKRQIEVVSGDHMNKVDLGANLAREWIERNNVEAIVDVPNSSVAFAVSISELTFFAMQAQEETSRGVEIYLAVTFLYFISAFAVNRVAHFVEQRVQVPGMIGSGR